MGQPLVISINGQPVGSIAGIGRINDTTLKVNPGDIVRLTQVILTWSGPATVLNLCWGLKLGNFGFDNGANLVNGLWSIVPLEVPNGSNTYIDKYVSGADIKIYQPGNYAARNGVSRNLPSNQGIHTWVWLVQDGADLLTDSKFLAIDTDSNVLEIVSTPLAVSGLNVRYSREPGL